LLRVDLNHLSRLRDEDALAGLGKAPALREVSAEDSKLPPAAFSRLSETRSLTGFSAGLGTAKRSQEAEAILGLPQAVSAGEYISRLRPTGRRTIQYIIHDDPANRADANLRHA
jgi:hypothetical protein